MKTTRHGLFIAAFISLNLFACSSKDSHFEGGNYEIDEATEVTANMALSLPPPPEAEAKSNAFAYHKNEETPADQDISLTQKQIIKTAQVKIQVEKLKDSKAIITKLVGTYGGYLATSNESRSNSDFTATFSIRVPAAKFEALLDELLKQGIFVDYNNVSAQDVTEEFVDIQSRLKTKRALETRYLELLKQAGKMEDILKLEAALQQIREEIESKEGRLKYLQNQVGFSTINLEIYEQVPYQSAPERGFWSKLAYGFGEGWESFLSFAIGVVTLWPFWLLLAGLVWLLRRWWRNRKLRKQVVA